MTDHLDPAVQIRRLQAQLKDWKWRWKELNEFLNEQADMRDLCDTFDEVIAQWNVGVDEEYELKPRHLQCSWELTIRFGASRVPSAEVPSDDEVVALLRDLWADYVHDEWGAEDLTWLTSGGSKESGDNSADSSF